MKLIKHSMHWGWKLSIALLSPILVACGPSQEEIDNTATITCNIMAESRNMDAALRIKDINGAREKIGQSPYLGDDAGIKESFHWGLCEQLVKNDDATYQVMLSEKRALLHETLAEAQMSKDLIAEQQRQEKEAEERRVKDKRMEALIAEYGWECPISEEELEQFWKTAWEQGNTELYQAAYKCHHTKLSDRAEQ